MKVLLAGCGKMGGAMLARWREQKLADDFIVIDPVSGNYDSIEDLPPEITADIVVFAVKPQTLPEIIGGYRRFAPNATFISIAAGKPLSFFQAHLGQDAKIIRSMPNTPAAIGKGITVAYASSAVTDRDVAGQLLEATGELIWVEDEDLMHPVTALSGSGPAYVFLLIETLEKAGVAIGLPPDTARQLARATVTGSAALAEAEPDTPASTLRQNVTSPGGTTAAALDILMAKKGIQPLFDEALAAASKRAKELSK